MKTKEQRKQDAVRDLRQYIGESGVSPNEVSRRPYDRWAESEAGAMRCGAIIRAWGSWSAAVDAATNGTPVATVAPSPPVNLPPSPDPDLDYEDITEVDITPFQPEERKTYVITYAQNATPVHDDFFASLMVYCGFRDAELHVVAGRYKNATSIWSDKAKAEDKWDPRVTPYLLVTRDERKSSRVLGFRRVRLCEGLVVAGDVPIQPTAIRPLTGFEAFAGEGSVIFGNPKIQLKSIAGATRGAARTITTTGACTVPNYTHSKAGKRGEMHHVIGAVVVDVVGGRHFMRHINATEDGSFIDLDKHYSPMGVEDAERPLALVLGDVHVASTNNAVVDATLRSADSIAEVLKPEKVLYHDVLDFRARNHHDVGNPDKAFAKHHGVGISNVKEEVLETIDFIDNAAPHDCDVVIVPSNHDDAFDRWLREADPKKDPENATFYHEMRARKLRGIEDCGLGTPALQLAYKRFSASGCALFLKRDTSYRIGDIECGFHSDKGTNGARSSMLSYAKLGVKTVIGHGHSPEILDGCYRTGVTAKLDQGYNSGPSSWQHAHCIIYANGKRALLFVTEDGQWR